MHFFLPLLLCFSVFAAADSPLDVGGRKQLFIDSRFMERSENITLRVNPAEKAGVVLDESGARVQGHISSVTEVDGKIRLFIGADSILAYDSEDGLQFRQTGTKLGGGNFSSVWRDPHTNNDARRYKHFWIRLSTPTNREEDGVYAGYSSDGIDVQPVGRVLPFYVDNPIIVHWDERVGKYVIFTRVLEPDAENERRIARIETDDVLAPWPHTTSEQDIIFPSPRNLPEVLAADEHDGGGFSDMYYSAAILYPEAQDAYIMFPAMFRHFHPDRHNFILQPTPGQWEDFGPLEVQLAVSRDGLQWSRPERIPYIRPGLADEWDRWYTVMAPGYVRRGNYLYQYYYSSGRTHDSAILREEYKDVTTELGGIGLVKQRLDGFVSADTDHHGGWIETPALTFEGNRLRLNIDTGSMGTAFVELRDAEGKALPGYELEACEEIGGNFIDQTVYWKRNADVAALQGKPVKIYFKLSSAKLYAFQFTGK